jgi:hypothetical protein
MRDSALRKHRAPPRVKTQCGKRGSRRVQRLAFKKMVGRVWGREPNGVPPPQHVAYASIQRNTLLACAASM